MCHTSRVRTLKAASSEGADGVARTQGLVRLVGVSLILVLVGGCGASSADKAGGTVGQKPRILTMANAGGDPAELDGFIKEVARLSSGTIRIQVESHWRADQAKAEPGLINDVKAGKADLGWAGSRAWDAVGVTSLRALHAPLLMDSYAVQERVIQS